jgi:hypothetical protein
MRRLSASTSLLALLVVPPVAAGTSDSVHASLQVSVQVVRSCSISSQDGHGAVRCGSPGLLRAVDPKAPTPRITQPVAGSSAGVVAIEF